MTPPRPSDSAKWPELGSTEDANRTHQWAVDCLKMWEAERAELRSVLRSLADEAAYAVCEPRRFRENEEHRQQRLGQAVAKARLTLR